MRILINSALGLGLAVLCATPALAQQGGGGRGFGGNPASLLANTSVQKELKLDDKQMEDAKKLAADLRTKSQAARESAQSLQGEERTKKMQEVSKEVGDEAKKGIAAILKPEQAQRFKEIQLQRRGATAFADPEIQSALKFDDSQKEKIKAIRDASSAKTAEIRKNSSQDRAELTKLVTAARDEASAKLTAVLTDEQKASWKEMLGSPFEYKADPRPAGN